MKTLTKKAEPTPNFTTGKRMDFMEFMRVVEMARVHPGTCICQEHFNFRGNEFGFAVRLLEQDRLQETYTGDQLFHI